MLARSAELARQRGVNLQGAVTWAFEFEDQPYFAGFRELATNGPEGLIDKPVLNVFRMFGKLSGSLVELKSSAAVPVDEIAKSSVTVAPDINGIATRNGNSLDILLWNYHDEDIAAPDATIALEVAGIPATSIHVTRTIVDANHANAHAAWFSMNSPQRLTPTQLESVREAGRLKSISDPPIHKLSDEPISLVVTAARQGVILIHLSW